MKNHFINFVVYCVTDTLRIKNNIYNTSKLFLMIYISLKCLRVRYILSCCSIYSMRRSRKFFCPTAKFFFLVVLFLVDNGIQIPLKAGHHRPASKTPFQWCFPGAG